MNVSFSCPALMPTVNDFTYNSEPSGSLSGSYDLICFPGVIISRLSDDTFTGSTGNALSVATLYIGDYDRPGDTACPSAGSADSSVIGDRSDFAESGGFATQFKFPYREPASLHLAALMMLLGDLAELVLAATPDTASPATIPGVHDAG